MGNLLMLGKPHITMSIFHLPFLAGAVAYAKSMHWKRRDTSISRRQSVGQLATATATLSRVKMRQPSQHVSGHVNCTSECQSVPVPPFGPQLKLALIQLSRPRESLIKLFTTYNRAKENPSLPC